MSPEPGFPSGVANAVLFVYLVEGKYPMSVVFKRQSRSSAVLKILPFPCSKEGLVFVAWAYDSF